MKTIKTLSAKTSSIRPDPNQPRKEFPAGPMADLRDSIQTHGIQERLIVREDPDKKADFMLVEGERRWRCATEMKLAEVPVEVREFKDEEEVRKYQRIVGTQRLNLNALEQARDLKRELDREQKLKPEFSADDLAKKLGISRASIYEKLSLVRLTPPLEKALLEGLISAGIAGALAKIPTLELQTEALKGVVEEEMSVRRVKEMVDEDYLKPLTGGGFKLDTCFTWTDAFPAELKIKDGLSKGCVRSCTECPHRTGNMLGQFPELKDRPNVCTVVSCFNAKVKAHGAAEISAAKVAGRNVVDPKEYASRSHNFERPDRKCWDDDKDRTYAQLAKAANVKPRLTLDPNTGAPMEVFTQDDIANIRTANDIKERNYGGMSEREKEAQKARQQKEKQYREAACGATEVVLGRLAKAEGGVVRFEKLVWGMLAEAAYHSLDITKHDFVAKRRGLARTQNEARDGLEKWFKAAHSDLEYAQMMLELLLCSRYSGGGYQEVKFSKSFTELCSLAGGSPFALADKAAKDRPNPATMTPKAFQKHLDIVSPSLPDRSKAKEKKRGGVRRK